MAESTVSAEFDSPSPSIIWIRKKKKRINKTHNSFRYPERPLIFLSACYVGLSLGYLVRIVVGGREVVACEGNAIRYGAAPSLITTGAGASFIGVSSSTSSPACVVTFLLVYFFGQAAGLWYVHISRHCFFFAFAWQLIDIETTDKTALKTSCYCCFGRWVILSLTWFLAAGRKWGSEAIARCSPYFHLVAWTIPAVQTAAALLMAAVDGDSLAGVCHVGVQQTVLLRWLVLFPLGLHLLLGGGFLLAGLAGLARIRRVLKEQGRPKAEKLEKLMIRIGIFSVLYSVPAAILLGCYAYEVAFHVDWGKTLTCSGCPSPPDATSLPSYQSRPDFSIFMLKWVLVSPHLPLWRHIQLHASSSLCFSIILGISWRWLWASRPAFGSGRTRRWIPGGNSTAVCATLDPRRPSSILNNNSRNSCTIINSSSSNNSFNSNSSNWWPRLCRLCPASITTNTRWVTNRPAWSNSRWCRAFRAISAARIKLLRWVTFDGDLLLHSNLTWIQHYLIKLYVARGTNFFLSPLSPLSLSLPHWTNSSRGRVLIVRIPHNTLCQQGRKRKHTELFCVCGGLFRPAKS